ncbi:VWA domain-containing protein [Acidobacteriia bacterium AH_259_A11_L15]|nr:VWA domain-containing protein [Acidobacteriia bacterium AH_259_A11_L15]
MKLNRSISFKAILGLATVCVLAGLSLPAVPPQQAEQQPEEEYRLRVPVPRVLVDVVVLGKDGQPVRNLQKEGFRVYEDGVPVEILEFTPVAVSTRVPLAPTEGEPAEVEEEEQEPGAVSAARLIAMYFGPMRPEDRTRALESAATFIQEGMTEADFVAIIAGTRLLQTFTTNKEALLTAIKLIQERKEGQQPELRASAPTPGADELIDMGLGAGDVPALTLGGDAAQQSLTGQLGELAEAATASIPSDLVEEFEQGIQSTVGLAAQLFISKILRDLEGIISALQSLEGRKSLVVFTSGFPVSRENKEYLDRAIERANRANVVVYNVNTRGLEAISGLGSASDEAPMPTLESSTGGRVVADAAQGITTQREYGALRERRSGLQALSNQTGGRWYQTNDFTEVFAHVQEDTQFYYLLSYRPPNPKRDGKFRKIKVEVASRSDVKIIARPGYSTWKEFEDFNDKDKRLYLQEALLSHREFADFPLHVGVSYFLLPDGNYYVPITYEFPVGGLPRKEKKREAEVKLEVYTIAASARAAAPPMQESIGVKSELAHFDPATAPVPSLEYFTQLVLPPGRYQLKFVAQDEFSGRVASVRRELVLAPPTDEEGLNTSGMILTDRLQPVNPQEQWQPGEGSGVANPLVVGNVKVVVRGMREFRADQPVYFYLQAYDLPPHPRTGRPQFMCAMTVRQGGRTVRRLGALPVHQYADPQRGLVAAPGTVNLRGLPPGLYELEVVARDDVSGRKRTLCQSFEILPPQS